MRSAQQPGLPSAAPSVANGSGRRGVTPARPPRYSPVRMREHMETTMRNLEAGLGSWESEAQRSRSAKYDYAPGERIALPVG